MSQLLLILRVRSRIVIWAMAATVTAVVAAHALIPASYKATTSLVLNYTGVDPSTGSGQLANYMTTQIDVIKSMGVASQVIDGLQLVDSPVWRQRFAEEAEGRGDIREWLAGRLLKKLEVKPEQDSAVVQISYKDRDPQFAATVANAFAEAYETTNLRLQVEPLKKTADYLNGHMAVLRDNLVKMQTRLSQYRKDKQLTSTEAHQDVESNRLDELSRQLIDVQTQLIDAASRQAQAAGQASESPQVLADPVIQNMKSQVVEAEARLAELAQRYTEAHPRYQAARAEVDKRRSALNASIRAAVGGIANQTRILRQREAQLSSAVAAQKQKVLALNQSRDELMMLTRDVENAQLAYDNAAQRMSKAAIEGQFHPSEVTVLSAAIAPNKPAGPGLRLLLAGACVLGALAGMGLALLAEMRDRRVRSVADLLDIVGLPVLGEIAPPFARTTRNIQAALGMENNQLKLQSGKLP